MMRPVSPNQPKTPMLNARVPRDVQDRARAKAERRGETISDVVRRKVEQYADAPDDQD